MRVETALTTLCGIVVAGGLGAFLWYLISPFAVSRDDDSPPQAGNPPDGEPWDDGRWS
jgi:hypothetical protein